MIFVIHSIDVPVFFVSVCNIVTTLTMRDLPPILSCAARDLVIIEKRAERPKHLQVKMDTPLFNVKHSIRSSR